MNTSRTGSGGPITFLDDHPARQTDQAEFVGGPLAGRHPAPTPEQRDISLADGAYVRSVRCADDGAIRFVWHPVSESSGTASDGPE